MGRAGGLGLLRSWFSLGSGAAQRHDSSLSATGSGRVAGVSPSPSRPRGDGPSSGVSKTSRPPLAISDPALGGMGTSGLGSVGAAMSTLVTGSTASALGSVGAVASAVMDRTSASKLASVGAAGSADPAARSVAPESSASPRSHCNRRTSWSDVRSTRYCAISARSRAVPDFRLSNIASSTTSSRSRRSDTSTSSRCASSSTILSRAHASNSARASAGSGRPARIASTRTSNSYGVTFMDASSCVRRAETKLRASSGVQPSTCVARSRVTSRSTAASSCQRWGFMPASASAHRRSLSSQEPARSRAATRSRQRTSIARQPRAEPRSVRRFLSGLRPRHAMLCSTSKASLQSALAPAPVTLRATAAVSARRARSSRHEASTADRTK